MHFGEIASGVVCGVDAGLCVFPAPRHLGCASAGGSSAPEATRPQCYGGLWAEGWKAEGVLQVIGKKPPTFPFFFSKYTDAHSLCSVWIWVAKSLWL